MMRLIKAGLMYGNLFEVNSAALVERYNRALKHLTGTDRVSHRHFRLCPRNWGRAERRSVPQPERLQPAVHSAINQAENRPAAEREIFNLARDFEKLHP